MPIVKTSPKGQVVIPVEIRRKFGIKPGTKIYVSEEEDRVILRPLSNNPIESLCGIFKGGPSLTKALMELRKEEGKLEEAKFARLIRRDDLAKSRARIRKGKGPSK